MSLEIIILNCVKEIAFENDKLKEPLVKELKEAKTRKDFLEIFERYSGQKYTEYKNYFSIIGKHMKKAQKKVVIRKKAA